EHHDAEHPQRDSEEERGQAAAVVLRRVVHAQVDVGGVAQDGGVAFAGVLIQGGHGLHELVQAGLELIGPVGRIGDASGELVGAIGGIGDAGGQFGGTVAGSGQLRGQLGGAVGDLVGAVVEF